MFEMELLACEFRNIPVLYCSHCAHPVNTEANQTSGDRRVGWCSNCRRVFDLPLFIMPGWVAGILVVLSMRLQLPI